MSQINRYNVRVYFLLLSEDKKHVLVSDEIIRGNEFTKFPGGGLEFGEGLIEGAMREAIEELGQEIKILKHFYTTDFFMQSAFNPADQIISVYYLAELLSQIQFRIAESKHDFTNHDKDLESFRWLQLNTISASDFDFPADKKVAELLSEKFN